MSDREAVRQAVLDYVEGIYHAEPARVEACVTPKLTKIGFVRAPDGGAYVERPMSYEQLMAAAAKGFAAHEPKQVEVQDVYDQIASARLVASWGVDLLQLAKIDGTWTIYNVLWQPLPKS